MFLLFLLRRFHFCRHRWWSVAGECKGAIIWAIDDLCFLVVSLIQFDEAIDRLTKNADDGQPSIAPDGGPPSIHRISHFIFVCGFLFAIRERLDRRRRAHFELHLFSCCPDLNVIEIGLRMTRECHPDGATRENKNRIEPKHRRYNPESHCGFLPTTLYRVIGKERKKGLS